MQSVSLFRSRWMEIRWQIKLDLSWAPVTSSNLILDSIWSNATRRYSSKGLWVVVFRRVRSSSACRISSTLCNYSKRNRRRTTWRETFDVTAGGLSREDRVIWFAAKLQTLSIHCVCVCVCETSFLRIYVMCGVLFMRRIGTDGQITCIYRCTPFQTPQLLLYTNVESPNYFTTAFSGEHSITTIGADTKGIYHQFLGVTIIM